ncbi:MAG: ribonuclease HII [Parcubacteria group bacterium]
MRIRIGIDEVGRGCLAGPVTVSAVSISRSFKKPICLSELRDSKLMTRLQREEWYEWMREERKAKRIFAVVSSVMPVTIDKINIARAANLAAWRAFKKLFNMQNEPAKVILDGSLFLRSRVFQENGMFLPQMMAVKTIPKADKKFAEVKLAAIFAKVTRDAYMRRMDLRYPEFGFVNHKGYGTREHIEAIKTRGIITGFHRQTFLKNCR